MKHPRKAKLLIFLMCLLTAIPFAVGVLFLSLLAWAIWATYGAVLSF